MGGFDNRQRHNVTYVYCTYVYTVYLAVVTRKHSFDFHRRYLRHPKQACICASVL